MAPPDPVVVIPGTTDTSLRNRCDTDPGRVWGPPRTEPRVALYRDAVRRGFVEPALAVADSCHAMTHQRVYRTKHITQEAVQELLADVRRRRLDGEAVQTVLAATGHARAGRRRAWPAGLSDRGVEVLSLLTRGASNKQVAKALGISPKTAGHHVHHIYDKIGVSTRAAAAVFAMQHGSL